MDKSCNLLLLTVRYEATEITSETEVVQKVMERLMKTQEEFRKAKMRAKLKDCQEMKVRGYQHQDRYLKGNKGVILAIGFKYLATTYGYGVLQRQQGRDVHK